MPTSPTLRTTSSDPRSRPWLPLLALGFGALLLWGAGTAAAAHLSGPVATYTLNSDFDEGSKANVDHLVPDQLQLPPGEGKPFPFIWVAVSSKGTAVKIDTRTGVVLGEFRTAPDGLAKNPSRTTVDQAGNVWVTNRDEAGDLGGVPKGSIVHLGLDENDGCVDRNGNSIIDTSTGLNDIRAWPNTGGVDTDGGVDTAEDECIIHFVRTAPTNDRHVAVNKDNNVWVSGTGVRAFQLISGTTGAILRTEASVNCGGYGGLIDKVGVIWSARPFLRWDTALPLTAPNYVCDFSFDSYGLCIDSAGNVWNTQLFGGTIKKFSPSGALLGTFSHGFDNAQGCVVDRNDHVWVAHSILGGGTTIGHLKPNGVWVGNVPVGSGPTGVAVDPDGKVWATNHNTGTVSRIDPTAGPLGTDGVTRVGAVDLETVYLGGSLYNYSDMTGSTNSGFIVKSGAWTIVHDSTVPAARWGRVSWNAFVPAGGFINVSVASSADGVTFATLTRIANGACFSLPDGQFLKVEVKFRRGFGNATPVLYDLGLTALPLGKERATALWAGTAVPASLEYETRGVRRENGGSGLERLAMVDLPEIGLYADSLEEQGRAAAGCDDGSARAYTQAAEVQLLSGQVVLEGLVQEAEVAYDAASRTATVTNSSYIAKVFVRGEQVNAEPITGPTTLTVPGVGTLAIFERDVTRGPFGASFRENIVHLYVASSIVPYSRHEVIVGGIQVQAGLTRFADLKPLILAEDDARSGRDAGSTPAGAIAVTPGAYDATAPAGDAGDTFSVALQHGEKIVMAVQPAPRVKALAGYLEVALPPPFTVTPPDVGGPGLEAYAISLYDPTGALRERSALGLPGAPQRVELNADLPGTWHLQVVRTTASASLQAVNYSLAVSITPVPLLPQMDALGPGDAPAGCGDAAAPHVGTGLWPGVVRDQDFRDVYTFDANIGELVTASLKPGEDADGVDMALWLWDRDCNLLQRADANLLVKGTPEVVLELPSQYTGKYFIGIERVNGVGNHYLALSIQNPLPTLPNNDAMSGGDAAPGRNDAGAITPPAPVFQGRLDEGDSGDAYRLALGANKRTLIAFHMSTMSSAQVTLYAPDGTPITGIPQGPLVVFDFTPSVSGTYGLEVRPVDGGGNYMVAYAQVGPP